MRFKKIFYLNILCWLVLSTISKTNAQQSKPDSNTVKKLLDSAYALESRDKTTALIVYRKAYEISLQLNYILGQARALHYSGIVYSDRSQYQQALAMYRKSLNLYHKIRYPFGEGACYTNIGNVYQFQSKLDSALSYYQLALNVFKRFSQLDALSQANSNVGAIFQQMQQFEKAYSYHLQAVNYAEHGNDSTVLCNSLINLGTVLNDLKKTEQSFAIQKKALHIAKLIDNYYCLQVTNINISDYYKTQKEYEKAIEYGLKSLQYALKQTTPFDIADIKKRVGDLYLLTGKYNTAKNYYIDALNLSRSLKTTEISGNIYSSLTKLYAAIGNYKQAYNCYVLAQQYKDSVLGEKQIKTINELEIKYQTAQKDQQLTQKQLQIAQKDLAIKQKTRLLMVPIAGIVLILIISSFIFTNYRNKIMLQNQNLQLLEKEKEINSLEAMIRGEEKERNRIAKELHDGVGGLLSATKMHFSVLKAKSLELQNDKSFEHALSLLDESASEIRKTAHNLMPELLVTHGLVVALANFCKRINSAAISVEFVTLGDVPKFKQGFELSVYRIVQELVNNVIKHSGASEAIVQISCHDHLLTMTVEDNGKGFDYNDEIKNGMGLSSLHSRVESFNGNMKVESEEKHGTSIYLEFDIQKLTVLANSQSVQV
ncbi:tetratricopeptide repeat-containing sensor histidine kinase [Solitalea lacus]|uniref:tetratricopeptide repeat-containing sensor histidine kinase n=1 Tax=Solitalea lacus TaxID=2911172 RepID=UPI001ED9D643|nr:tetratricopeptide repeat protein [Solitalea lacus]UKJ06768.1 sensor histidine kinase [Solitalea lacus]